MPTYEVEVQFEDMLFTVEANSEEEAEEKALEMYYESGGPPFYSVEALLVEDDDA